MAQSGVMVGWGCCGLGVSEGETRTALAVEVFMDRDCSRLGGFWTTVVWKSVSVSWQERG